MAITRASPTVWLRVLGFFGLHGFRFFQGFRSSGWECSLFLSTGCLQPWVCAVRALQMPLLLHANWATGIKKFDYGFGGASDPVLHRKLTSSASHWNQRAQKDVHLPSVSGFGFTGFASDFGGLGQCDMKRPDVGVLAVEGFRDGA